MEVEKRPWGFYRILAEERDYKVKHIVVHPGKRTSLQRHAHRSEHWYVLYGEVYATLNETMVPLMTGNNLDIPVGTIHRIENRGCEDCLFIEIQKGDYLGEDDIERLEDDYGRAP